MSTLDVFVTKYPVYDTYITRLLQKYKELICKHNVFAFFLQKSLDIRFRQNRNLTLPYVPPLINAHVYLAVTIFREIRPLQKEIKGSLQM